MSNPHPQPSLSCYPTPAPNQVRGKKAPWNRSKKATKGLSSDEVFKKGSLPVQILFK